MSSSQYFSYSSTSYSSSSSTNSQGHSQKYTEQSYSSNRHGTTTQRRYEETGKPTREEIIKIPASRQVGIGAVDNDRRIEDISEEQKKRDKEYEERMEDEYAKREGGA
jgi:hypothetical protein